MTKDKTTSSEIKKLKKELERCEELKNEYLNGWQRAKADFINYKKEESSRIEDLMNYAREEMIINLLPIIDNLELAEKNIPLKLKEEENVKGILQIKNQIVNFLKNQGLEEINSLGEKFDPNIHEALDTVESEKEDEKESGVIVEEVKKGYKLNGKVIRATKVKVAK